MWFKFADRCRAAMTPAQSTSAATAWRWRFFDPRTGEQVMLSEPLTAEQVRAINPLAELIPGSRVVSEGDWTGR
ncbi:hypothetical protein [Piscinibacter sakaiensis]|uniref:hypothetical protein n=1 Tax=Piscinibacter sakaiensis TaxID=1547922 RepID=UPI003AAF1037